MHLIFRLFFSFLFVLGLSNQLFAQTPSKEKISFHKERRNQLQNQMAPNSVAVIFTNPVRNRANDVDYVYHPDPNFYYLTGWREPQSVLLLFSSVQHDEQGPYKEILFIQERNPRAEQWNGRRLGKEGALALGLERVYERQHFSNFPLDYDAFDEVLIVDFKNDERDNPNDPADLYSMKAHLKTALHFPENFNKTVYQLQQAIRTVSAEDFEALKRRVSWYADNDKSVANDEIIKDFLALETLEVPADLKMKTAFELRRYNFDVQKLEHFLGDLREEKTAYEMEILKKAVEISAIGQVEVMKAMKPGMSEREIQGIHEYVFKKYGAAYEGYPSIVGAGHNACVLHYIENNDIPEEQDLMLMDLGAEYQGYTADVTRTIPVKGTFSEEQRLLYQLVYDAQEAGIAQAVIGSTSTKVTQATQEVIKKGLLALGIIEEEKDFRHYFPHGAAHHIGLDVHDLSNYGPFPANSVITVEPGIYIPENSDCDPKWWGIGIRIEDDIWITEKGPVNLSAKAPRHWKDIEAMMAQPSPLDAFRLPELSTN